MNPPPAPRSINDIVRCLPNLLKRPEWRRENPDCVAHARTLALLIPAGPSIWRNAEIRRLWNVIERLLR